ncbi:hypothetical protein [Actinacidiphila glaucinigra]|uniref:hypothetical protein n=1 Tax=Actinacidiphila glaucinigra TaxID=235986 RepID=UPI00371D35D6
MADTAPDPGNGQDSGRDQMAGAFEGVVAPRWIVQPTSRATKCDITGGLTGAAADDGVLPKPGLRTLQDDSPAEAWAGEKAKGVKDSVIGTVK